ncbi:conserved hypothetical protein [Vibrio phage 142E35-1]|nr:conserved hypothetical protein [Vibrio phage 142E35-1]
MYKYVQPVCQPSPRPVLSDVTDEELRPLSDETFEKLYRNEQKLMNWGKANVDILTEVCQSK